MNKHKMNVELAGEYRLVINRNGEEIDTGWFPNLITNLGLEGIGNNFSGAGSGVKFCRIGTGTTTPAFTDQQLVNQLAVSPSGPTSQAGVNEGAPNYSYLATYQYVFAQGAVVGNMTEIGVGATATGNSLFSRALILDGSGSPTTITLLAIDQLTVYYRLRWYPPLGDASGTLVLSGVSYPYTIRLANAATFGSHPAYVHPHSEICALYMLTVHHASAVLGAITGVPTASMNNYGRPYGTGSVFSAAYVGASLKRVSTCTLGPSDGNATGGIGALTLFFTFGGMTFQMVFSTPIPKTNTKTLSFSVEMAWARH